MPNPTDTYKVGTDGSTIKLAVNVSSSGIVKTIAGWPNGTITPLPNCDDDGNGNISNCTVGVNTNIKGKSLKIITAIDLQPIPPAQWQTMFDSLLINYTLQGGDDGVKSYTYGVNDKSKDSTGQFISVNKTINLV